MRKTLLVMRQELAVTFRRPSYVAFGFVAPVLAVLILAGVRTWLGQPAGAGVNSSGSATFQMRVEGYVDRSGLIRVIPRDFPAGHLLAYDTEAAAQQALAAGAIAAYYVIPADYVARGEVFYVYAEGRPLIQDGQEWVIKRTLLLNLLGGDEVAAGRIWEPVWHLETLDLAQPSQPEAAADEDCSRPGFACWSNPVIRYLPLGLMALFYVSFFASSNMLFGSIAAEKENRTIEVVLQSISARQLFGGKLLGLALAGLLETGAWLGALLFALNPATGILNLPQDFSFPVDLLAWSLALFLAGYALYASLMAGAGVLVPRLKETGGANLIVMLPLAAGYVVGLLAPLAGADDRALPVALSLFPLTAPVVMIVRLTNGGAPVWQLLLSIGLTCATAFVAFRAAVALFTAQNLLSGQPFSARRYLRALLGIRTSI